MYRPLIRPSLFLLDPERAHDLALAMASALERFPFLLRMIESRCRVDDQALHQHLFGMTFQNPLSIAAGLDKNGQHLPFWKAIGCGFAEIGSVTWKPSKGNPKPRMFRLPRDRAIINRMGLNNHGVQEIVSRWKPMEGFPVGINIAKTHDPAIVGEAAVSDIVSSVRVAAPHASYLVLNVSCPNTREGKTFEDPESLDSLLMSVRAVPDLPPLLVKLSPDLDEGMVIDIVSVLERYRIDGVVVANTSRDRRALSTRAGLVSKIGAGGLSGAPIRDRSTMMIRQLYGMTQGRMPIIGVGGIMSAEDAYVKMRAGASLIQLYTGLVYEGPGLISQINHGLIRLLARDHFSHLGECVGSDA